MGETSSKTFIAVSALIGTIVGAGFLGIPYAVMQSGFLIGLAHLIVIALIVCLTILYLGEVSLRTKENHQLSGYAEKYLGKTGKKIMFFAVAFGVYSAILAYLIAEGESLSVLIFGDLSYSLQMSFIFWFFLSLLGYFGLKALKKSESIGIMLLFFFIISISILLANKIELSNLSYINFNYFMNPFGVIIFAFLGFTAIPEVKRILSENKSQMKRSIIYAYSISLAIYIIFTFLVIGYKGHDTPELATIALGAPFIILGMITMFNAYLALSVSMIDTLKYDFKKSMKKAWFLTISIPILLIIILQLVGKADFTKVLGIGGVISGGLTAILILIMHKNAKLSGDRKPEYSLPNSNKLNWLLIVIFILGAIFEILNFIN